MNATSTDNGHAGRDGLRSANARAARPAETLRAAGAHEIHDLIADVEELVGRVSDAADPEIRRLRARVEAAIATARTAIADGTAQVQRQAADAVDAGDRYVRDRPWQAIGVAAAAGVAVGLLVARR